MGKLQHPNAVRETAETEPADFEGAGNFGLDEAETPNLPAEVHEDQGREVEAYSAAPTGSIFDDDGLFNEVIQTSYFSHPVIRLVNKGFFETNTDKINLGKSFKAQVKDAKKRFVLRGLTRTPIGDMEVANASTDIHYLTTPDGKPPTDSSITDKGVTLQEARDELETRRLTVDRSLDVYVDLTAVLVDAYEYTDVKGSDTPKKEKSGLVGDMVILQVPVRSGARVMGYLQQVHRESKARYGAAHAQFEQDAVHVFMVGKLAGSGVKEFYPWDIRRDD